jgi:PAS domain S-box-containing protein
MVLALCHYLVRRDLSVVLALVTVYAAGLLAAVQALTASGLLAVVVEPERLGPLLAGLARLGKAVLVLVLCGWWLVSARGRGLLQPRTVILNLAVGSVLLLTMALFLALLLNATPDLPVTLYPTSLIKRPWELAALVLFAVAVLAVLPRFYQRFPGPVTLGLLLAAGPDLFAQFHSAFGAAAPGDRHEHVALLFQVLAALGPVGGLVVQFYHAYRDEAEAVVKFQEAEHRLKARLLELEDSTERQQQDEADRASAEEALRVLDRAIAASSCGIIITDPKVPDNQIIYVNPTFEKITGYSAEEAIGRGLDFLYQREQDQPAAHEVAAAVAEARDCRVVIRNYRKDGRMIWSELDISPVPDENGMLTHYIGIMTDITDRVRAEEEHKKFTAKLEHTNRELADFVHVASHDLQEPLRKVQVFGDRLLAKCQDTLPEEGKLYLDRMQNSVRRMDRLIRDLLTYSRIGRKEQEVTAVDLNAVLKDVLSDLEVRLEETRGKVEVQVLPTIEADATQMRQLLQNLIGNALKFHRPNVPPIVRITAQNVTLPVDGHPMPHHQLYVQDNGIGFDEKYNERIFTVFQRLHTGNTYEGTGLGLTVCRKIAERHGGTITARSAPGEGSTFIVTLPAVRRTAE